MTRALKSVASGTALAFFALLAVASGGKKGDGAGGEGGTAASTGGGGSIKQSCNQTKLLGTCTEYPEGSTFALAETACNMIPDAGSVWGKDRCPTERIVGKCVDAQKDAFYKNETEYYYAPEHTTESAKKDCIDDAVTKGKTFTPGDFKPKEGEARASCTRKLIGSKRATPDRCDEYPYATSKESFDVIKMNCSGEGDKLEIGKGCTKEQKESASSKCEEKDGAVVYNFPPDSKNAKDFCESEPNNGKFTKLAGAAAPAAPAAKAAAAPVAKGAAAAPKGATSAAPAKK
jgi:hypothetical protein